MLGSIGDREHARQLTSINNLTVHLFMEGFNYLHKLVRTTDFAQQLPESLPIDRVKGLGQIYEYHVEVLMFSTLLLHLSGREDHVRGASSCTEPTLTLRYDVVAVNVSIKPVQEDAC